MTLRHHDFITTITMICVLFFFVFGVPFNFLPVNSSKLAWLFIAGLMVLRMGARPFPLRFNKELCALFLGVLFLALIAALFALMHQTYDFNISYAYLIMACESLLGAIFFYSLFLQHKNLNDLLRYFIIIFDIQSAIILFMFVDPSARELVFSITDGPSSNLFERYENFRGLGLAGSLTYDLAISLSIGMMFVSYLLCVTRDYKVFYCASWLIMFTSILMTGRSGLIGVILSLLILLYCCRSKIGLSSVFYLIFYVLIMTVAIYAMVFNVKPEIIETFSDFVMPYAFEMFYNIDDGRGISSRSSDNLMDMYFEIPESTFLFGDGYWKSPSTIGYYMSTDAGYMRHVLFYGIVPSLLLYGIYGYGFLRMHIKARVDTKVSFVVGSLMVYYFVAQIKGDFLLGSAMNIKIFYMLLVFMVLKRRRELVCPWQTQQY